MGLSDAKLRYLKEDVNKLTNFVELLFPCFNLRNNCMIIFEEPNNCYKCFADFSLINRMSFHLEFCVLLTRCGCNAIYALIPDFDKNHPSGINYSDWVKFLNTEGIS